MMLDETRPETILCPGCGGRNDPSAHECEWCGRLFVPERRQINARLLASAIGAVLLIGFVGIVAVALVGSRSANRPVPQIPPTVIIEPIGADADEEPLIAADPTRVAPTPSPAPTELAAEFVRIANTGGTGAFIRREAATNSPGIVAYRDGIVLKVVGSDLTADGRVWRQVEDRQGNRGWTPREYLEASPIGF